jgi:hypothetical protein
MRWSISGVTTRHPMVVPLLWSALFTTALAVAYGPQSWPLVDLYGFFSDAQAHGWSETLADAFGRGREYRPFHVLLVKLLYQVGGLNLWFYKTLVLLEFMAILAVLVWILRPADRRQSVWALLAVCCVAGLPTSAILLGLLPGHSYALVTLLVLLSAAMALEPPMRAYGWVFLPVTLTALLLWELGILAPAVVTALWLARAPGVGRTGVGATWAAVAIYAGIRLSLGNQGDALQFVDSGPGFTDRSRGELGELFDHAPYLFAMYNVAASALTVLFSEPRAGKFKFVESLLHGNTPFWLWWHLISSTITTVAIGSLFFLRKQFATRDVQLVALGLALMTGGSALGFLYTRDRISVLVGIGYAVLLYVALAALWKRGGSHLRGRFVIGLAIVVLAGMWTVRAAEMWLRVRDTAWETYVEWTDRYEFLGGTTRPQTLLLRQLRAAALANRPNDPRDDPDWTYLFFERGTAR